MKPYLQVYVVTVHHRIIAVAFCPKIRDFKVAQWCLLNWTTDRCGGITKEFAEHFDNQTLIATYTGYVKCDMEWHTFHMPIEDMLSLPGAVPMGDSILFTPSTD